MIPKNVLALGAGLQSTALYLMAHEGKLPGLDFAVFADTKGESLATYKHLAWLVSLGGPEIHIVSKGNLEQNLLVGVNSDHKRFVSIPAFVRNVDGKQGITRRQCTQEYKIRPIIKEIRTVMGLRPYQRIKPGTSICEWFGISADEMGRSVRIIKNAAETTPWIVPRFPLLEMEMTRNDCAKFVEARVPHEVPRSACVFCPYKIDSEWIRTRKDDPDGWARSVELDHALRRKTTAAAHRLDGLLYLHRSLKPLDEVDFKASDKQDPQKGSGFYKECLGMCGM